MAAPFTRRSMIRTALAAAVAVLAFGFGSAKADSQKKSDNFQLTRNDFTELSFVPGAPGQIKVDAEWKGSGLVKKDIALRMQLVRPDGTIAKEAVGGSPLPLTFTLSAAEFAQNKEKAYKVVMRHNVAGQDAEKVNGSVTVTFPIATVTVFNNSANPIDVGGKGGKTEVTFALPNAPGKLDTTISFKDGLFDSKKLVAQLVRPDGAVVASTAGDSGLRLVRNISQADLDKGLSGWKIRLTNNENGTIKGIAIVVKYTPAN